MVYLAKFWQSNSVSTLESSGIKNLTEQVLLLMTGYATSSCSNMDSVWRILKLNVDKQVGPISPNAMGKLSQQSFVIR